MACAVPNVLNEVMEVGVLEASQSLLECLPVHAMLSIWDLYSMPVWSLGQCKIGVSMVQCILSEPTEVSEII